MSADDNDRHQSGPTFARKVMPALRAVAVNTHLNRRNFELRFGLSRACRAFRCSSRLPAEHPVRRLVDLNCLQLLSVKWKRGDHAPCGEADPGSGQWSRVGHCVQGLRISVPAQAVCCSGDSSQYPQSLDDGQRLADIDHRPIRVHDGAIQVQVAKFGDWSQMSAGSAAFVLAGFGTQHVRLRGLSAPSGG